jgi:endonuclease-8
MAMLSRTDLERLVSAAASVLHMHLNGSAAGVDHRSRLAVYGRNGQRCRRCGDTIEVRRLGDRARLLYWCPGCQTNRGPRPAPAPEEQRPMDPHPAAAKFLAELPWRRRDTLAG